MSNPRLWVFFLSLAKRGTRLPFPLLAGTLEKKLLRDTYGESSMRMFLVVILLFVGCSRPPERETMEVVLDKEIILDQVLADWLIGPNSEDARSYLMDSPLKTVLLERQNLPKGYMPRVNEVTFSIVDDYFSLNDDYREIQDGELYIAFDQFDVHQGGSTEISFFHTGAHFIGGAGVIYNVMHSPSGWKVVLISSDDP